MVNNHEEHLDRIFQALSDQTRRAMLAQLATGESRVSDLAEPFQMSLAAVSKHLKVLEVAGLVQKNKVGRSYRCQARFDALNNANALLEQLTSYWNVRLDALDTFLTKQNSTGENSDAEQQTTEPKSGKSQTRHTESHSRKKRKGV